MKITIQLDDIRLPAERGPYKPVIIQVDVVRAGEDHQVEIRGYKPANADEDEFWGIMIPRIMGQVCDIVNGLQRAN